MYVYGSLLKWVYREMFVCLLQSCELYVGGSLGVESVQQKEEQAFVARVNTAKSVSDVYYV